MSEAENQHQRLTLSFVEIGVAIGCAVVGRSLSILSKVSIEFAETSDRKCLVIPSRSLNNVSELIFVCSMLWL